MELNYMREFCDHIPPNKLFFVPVICAMIEYFCNKHGENKQAIVTDIFNLITDQNEEDDNEND